MMPGTTTGKVNHVFTHSCPFKLARDKAYATGKPSNKATIVLITPTHMLVTKLL
jgi:hypothetical protein